MLVSDTTNSALAQQAATAFLPARHPVQDFFIMDNDDIRQTITSTTDTLTLHIADISLVVGGIGVMNMLASVSERVREIGVRMAVDALRSDILHQFLTEAGLVGFVGAAAFGVSTLIGVAPGYLPARRAAMLDSVVALSRDRAQTRAVSE